MTRHQQQIVVHAPVATATTGRSYPLGATLIEGGATLTNRTYHYWHVFVPDGQAGQIYAYRACGPFDPARGLMLDPYGRAIVVPKEYSCEVGRRESNNTATAMKCVVTDRHDYDREGDVPLRRPWSRAIIYEMHVRRFTVHANSGVAQSKRGTHPGLVEKIPYLQEDRGSVAEPRP